MSKIVYIAHPVGGDVENNLVLVAEIVRYIALNDKDVIPVAPYFLYCHALDDNDMAERIRGMEIGLGYIIHNRSNLEIWLYGDRISNGMKEEIITAHNLDIKVVAMTNETKSDYVKMFKNLF
jgi:hypothetical protein